jgi:hypothetical protein
MKNVKTKLFFILIFLFILIRNSDSKESDGMKIPTEKMAIEKELPIVEPESLKNTRSYNGEIRSFSSFGSDNESEKGRFNRTNPCNLDASPSWCK